ncbi:hypothetical protein [Caldivirga maquilingensis]|uniref:Uncharacterized protein n=1 Tax=Caldivirga maquilingensis (strain ATCC 700844 / DSM 13496 / JCM 10307 / IC-167) TaxID=397948 RepID=A8MCB8_CALMQ|nr:hypothetical protein [Caldivirga maquilingensis]ABW01424.1 conserved hypothetical protein [Caldivirga maquilingensis IC-167]
MALLVISPATTLVTVILLGASHAVEPDHIATLRLLKDEREYLLFGLSHGIGFILISIPLVLIIAMNKELELIGNLVGMAFAAALLIGELMNKELEIGVKGSMSSGIIQGALAITPTKVLVAVMAAEVGLITGMVYIVLFIAVSSMFIFIIGLTLDKLAQVLMKHDVSKPMNIAIAVIALAIMTTHIVNMV